MTIALIAVSLCLLVALSALVMLTVGRQIPGPSLVGETVAITTTSDDRGYRGVVLAEHADRITLHQAFVATASGEKPVGGVVHLYRKDFPAVQQIEATD